MIYLFSFLIFLLSALTNGAFLYLYLREQKKTEHLLNLVLQSNGKRPVPAMRLQGKMKPEKPIEPHPERDYRFNIVGDRKDSLLDTAIAKAIEKDNKENGVYGSSQPELQ